jgi:SAM-dependent methyltransferase
MPFYKNQQQQVDFLKQIVNINKDTRILDLGYGQGFHLTKLQELSNFVYGYDKEINEARSPSLPNTKKLDFFQEDWDLDNLDLVYCLAPFFGEDWANFDLLASKVTGSLKTGGKFVLDLFDWNSMEVGTVYKDWSFPKDNLISVNRYKREEKSGLCFRKVLTPENNTFKTIRDVKLYWRVFERSELINIASRAGLKLTHECFNFDINQKGLWQPQLTKKRLVVVFEKI